MCVCLAVKEACFMIKRPLIQDVDPRTHENHIHEHHGYEVISIITETAQLPSTGPEGMESMDQGSSNESRLIQ